ncbi:MAG: DUF3160 domain-containing protein [Deltaproteobacteria bacterium]|nr:DUF3160 domain-containing protein [Deltaproteobacteria bacterium]
MKPYVARLTCLSLLAILGCGRPAPTAQPGANAATPPEAAVALTAPQTPVAALPPAAATLVDAAALPAAASPAEAAVELAATASPSAGPPTWPADKLVNARRVPGLGPHHKELLAKQGFFLAPLPRDKKGQRDVASHLFHIYERNDYLRFSSYVTADLAVDTVHIYLDTVMRNLEERELQPRLATALAALAGEAETLRKAAVGPGTADARRNALYWHIAWRLTVGSKVRIPPELKADVAAAAAAIERGTGSLPADLRRGALDLSLFKVRGHYTRNDPLSRYFRGLSWLSLATFATDGPNADVAGAVLAARTVAGSPKGSKALAAVVAVTNFLVGPPDGATVASAILALDKASPGWSKRSADELLQPPALQQATATLVTLPAATANEGRADPSPQVRMFGTRVFADAAGIAKLIEPLQLQVNDANRATLLPATMGALGAAAVLGSRQAQTLLEQAWPSAGHPALQQALAAGQKVIAGQSAERWHADAYHGTLDALRGLLVAPSASAPALQQSPQWPLRALLLFAGGWAELRHDTLLYSEPFGAECDNEVFDPPPQWVEPLPELYAGLQRVVKDLSKAVSKAGISDDRVVSEKVKMDADSYDRELPPIGRKTSSVLGFLETLRTISLHELAGKLPNADERTALATIGGTVEWILIELSDSETFLSDKDDDMAVVADTFTWRPTQQAVEVAVGHPDLIFAVIPGPKGPVLARGAVMSYREWLAQPGERWTDEAWRAALDAGRAVDRPAWARALYAETPGAVVPPKEPQYRCGPGSGSGIDAL